MVPQTFKRAREIYSLLECPQNVWIECLGPFQTLHFGRANVVSNLIDQLSSMIAR